MSVSERFQPQIDEFHAYIEQTVNPRLPKPFCIALHTAQKDPSTYLLSLFNTATQQYYATYTLPVRPYDNLPASIFGRRDAHILHDTQLFIDDVDPSALSSPPVSDLVQVMLYLGVVFKTCLSLTWVQHDCFQEDHEWDEYPCVMDRVLMKSHVSPVQVCPNATMTRCDDWAYANSMRRSKQCIEDLLRSTVS